VNPAHQGPERRATSRPRPRKSRSANGWCHRGRKNQYRRRGRGGWGARVGVQSRGRAFSIPAREVRTSTREGIGHLWRTQTSGWGMPNSPKPSILARDDGSRSAYSPAGERDSKNVIVSRPTLFGGWRQKARSDEIEMVESGGRAGRWEDLSARKRRKRGHFAVRMGDAVGRNGPHQGGPGAFQLDRPRSGVVRPAHWPPRSAND